ncbi:FAD-binding oxidoreductase [Mucilaginibacter sp. P25]|uniref:Ring-1,2-phenylacetyl-CoA epoxidase subunit PaaE n=1 Tax=Mucilaginibacter gossypii TaxID=551996 RepID=A0A1G7WDG6_9SPHI|nr:ferredoxin--NADP reductase [Mucilaginibacter gossypii]SDG69993.1 ring-1,2-phenylacetyl-CoA epoxidase subunit PaaE [Mucilaginibacter gossypii]
MFYFTLQVVDIRQETSDTVTLCLKQPGLKKIKYLPGQYLTLAFKINGRKYNRPYSFSSAPGADPHLEVTIKRVPGGIVSNHINDFVKVGDQVEVLPPMGDFIFDETVISNDKHIILWGAGSGITPLISIAKYILHHKTGHKISLIYGNKNSESVIFGDKISELKKNHHQELKTWHFHSQLKISDSNPEVIEGRISPKKVLSVMKGELDLENTVHYICGPAGLKESVKEVLASLDVKSHQVFSEEFEVVLNPKDFENITTQVVQIKVGDTLSKVEVVKGKSILDAGLDAGLEIDYSCQTGSCLVCKAKLLAGEVKMPKPAEEYEKLLPDECLLCCSYPVTDNVQVSV